MAGYRMVTLDCVQAEAGSICIPDGSIIPFTLFEGSIIEVAYHAVRRSLLSIMKPYKFSPSQGPSFTKMLGNRGTLDWR